MRKTKKGFLTTIFLLLFGAIGLTQYLYDGEKTKAAYSEPLVMSPEVVRIADLGLDNAAADLIWLTSIQYFGGSQSKTNQNMSKYLFLAADLDPKFAYPYAFGALILPSIGQPDLGIALAQKGLDNGVQDWRIPYYMATTYYLTKNDSENAAKYFDIAANTPGAPDNIIKVAASFGSRTDKRSRTEAIWTGIYENSNDEIIKERAKNYIIHLEILDFLDQAVAQYYKINNKYPTDLNELIANRIIKAIPADPFGLEFNISSDGKVGVK